MSKQLDIQAELAAMDAMTPKQLREKYHAVFGEPTRSGNRRFMIKRIAWRLQANAEGDLPERVRERALELARDGDLRTTAPKAPMGEAGSGRTVERPARLRAADRLTPGTQLTRSYKGTTVVVTVLVDGIAYAGKKYRSLSAAAKAITGTHISGHRFFGLTRPATKENTK
jgi:Protein of unknown function (DUF2924)